MEIFMTYIFPVLLALLILFIALVVIYFKTLYTIQQAAAGEINDAEDAEAKTDEEEQKQKEQVVARLFALVPPFLRLFITEAFIADTVQALFDKCKEFARKQAERKQAQEAGEKPTDGADT